MANETIEFDIVVNGKPAKTSIEEVEKAQSNLEKNTAKATKSMSTNWASVGAKIAVAAVAIGAVASKGMTAQKAMFGLSDATKDYVKQASIMYGHTQEQIAGFVQTGKSAGLAGKEIASMIDMAVALGRKYPHESTETFIDNLSMLNSTGEAQGYIVDVLEQKYGAIDLKTISLADKMAVLEEATSGVNKKFDELSAAKLDKAIAAMSAEFDELGETILTVADESGILWVLNKAIGSVGIAFSVVGAVVNKTRIAIKGFFGRDVKQDLEDHAKLLDKISTKFDKYKGKTNGDVSESIITPDIKGTSKPREQRDIEATTKSLNGINAKKKQLIAEQKKWEKEQEEEYWDFVDGFLEEEYQNRVDMEQKKVDMIKEANEAIKQSNKDMADDMSETLTDFIIDGENKFEDFAKNIAKQMLNQQISGAITGAMGGASIGSMFGYAQGGVPTTNYAQGGVPRFAQGGIVSSATKMRFAQGGTGLVGERNRPEGVLPLARTASGDLGVMSSGGGGVVINIENNTGTPIDTSGMTETTNSERNKVITFVLEGASKNTLGLRDALKNMR